MSLIKFSITYMHEMNSLYEQDVSCDPGDERALVTNVRINPRRKARHFVKMLKIKRLCVFSYSEGKRLVSTLGSVTF